MEILAAKTTPKTVANVTRQSDMQRVMTKDTLEMVSDFLSFFQMPIDHVTLRVTYSDMVLSNVPSTMSLVTLLFSTPRIEFFLEKIFYRQIS